MRRLPLAYASAYDLLRYLHFVGVQGARQVDKEQAAPHALRVLIVIGTNYAREVPLESLSIVDNGSRYEENIVPRIREHPCSRRWTLDLGECRVGCVQNAEIARHQCAVRRHHGELAGIGKVRRWFDRRHSGRLGNIQSQERSCGSIERACACDGTNGAEAYGALAVIGGEDTLDRAVDRPAGHVGANLLLAS